MSEGASRHTDRTKQIDPIVVVVALVSAASENNARNLRSRDIRQRLGMERVDVAKGQTEINDER